MYRLLLYYLIVLLVAAMALSQLGYLHYDPLFIAVSATTLLIVCWVTNKIFATVLNVPSNSESTLITALILALIISPISSLFSYNFTFLLAAGGLAIASKYLLVINKKHIFNPAAIGVVLTAVGPRQSASWWVGTAAMLPLVLIGGVLLVRKIRRIQMIVSFFAASFVATIVYTVLSKGSVISSLDKTALSSAFFFLAFVMLTEPQTSPVTVKKQTWYAILVGILLPPQVHVLNFYSSPELALVISNIFSYIVSPKTKLFPVLSEKLKIASHSVDFVFNPGQQFAYQPGQYMEWTLPHSNADSRGVRRYFTLASSPTEPDIRIGVKFYKKGSSYKQALLDIDQDSHIVASQIAGDFILPKNQNKKIVFIAGGIGVTPFRSMVKYLLDRNERRSVTMLYSARNAQDLAYQDIWEEARQKLGFKITYFLTGSGLAKLEPYTRSGFINTQAIQAEIPDYQDCLFYISGTHAMVTSVQDALQVLGVRNNHIKIDFFSGYVSTV